jgi:hypothetical protein
MATESIDGKNVKLKSIVKRVKFDMDKVKMHQHNQK